MITRPPKDITGLKVGLLTVVRMSDRTDTRGGRWICKCDCGEEADVPHYRLTGGIVRSCGCQHMASRYQVTHGMTGTKTHKSWCAMRERITNPNCYQYEMYGGRGIKICEAFMEFSNFFAVLGVRPNGLTLDRINNNAHYSCGACEECRKMGWEMNVRWATPKMQRDNNRNCYLVTINGETKSRLDWCRSEDISYMAVRGLMNKGLSATDAILERIRMKKLGLNRWNIRKEARS